MDGSSKKVVELKAHGDVAEEDPARRGGPGTDEAYANERRLAGAGGLLPSTSSAASPSR